MPTIDDQPRANLDDPTQPPRPEGGWSGRMTTISNAVVVPTSVQDMIQPMGVFDAEGHYRHEAVLWRGRPLMVPPPLPEAVETLPGRWIWGGVLLNHFGHFLTESTGRLWAVDAVKGAVDGMVMVSKRDSDDTNGPAALQDYHRLFLDLLGMDLPIRILARPTRIDTLEVPGQGFGIGPMAKGTDAFRAFVHRRFARNVAPAGGERLYISRSGLSALRGGILQEDRLESLLADCGYEIFHPQRHSLVDQVARYKAARQVIALDGSALHLLAMVATADQQVAMIKRRDSHVSDGIVDHLAAFSGRQPLVVDVILRDWIRSDRKRADRFSVGELDFAALGRVLAEAGFVPADVGWSSLSEAQAQEAIRGFEAKLKRGKLTFVPMPRKGAAPRPSPEPEPERSEPKRNLRREARMAAKAERKARG